VFLFIVQNYCYYHYYYCYYYSPTSCRLFTTIHRETNYVSGVYNFLSILWALYGTAHVMLCPLINVLSLYISTVQSVCAVHNMTAVFCSSLILFIPGTLLSQFIVHSRYVAQPVYCSFQVRCSASLLFIPGTLLSQFILKWFSLQLLLLTLLCLLFLTRRFSPKIYILYNLSVFSPDHIFIS
jgi:hypothetical protein